MPWFCARVASLLVPWISWIVLSNSFWTSTHTPHLLWNIINESHKICCIIYGYKCWNSQSPKACLLIFPLVRKRNPILFVFNARFIKQRGCWARKCLKIYAIHHVLKCINTNHVQMAKAVVSKCECTISRGRLHHVHCIYLVYVCKIIFVQVFFVWCYHNGFAVARFYNVFVQVELDLQTIPYKFSHQMQIGLQLGYIECNFYINRLILFHTSGSMTMNPILTVFTTLSSSKCTLCGVITSYVSNVVVCKVMCLVAPKFIIHLHMFLKCVPIRISIV